MTRVILKGESRKLRKVTVADLPADRNLDDSCFSDCDLSRLDLSTFSLKRVASERCLFKRTVLPSSWANMKGWLSRCHYEGGDPRPYEGAVIPADRPISDQHDLVVEILFRYADKLRGANADHVRAVAVHLQDYVKGCYESGVRLAAQRLGGRDKVLALFGPAFASYPELGRGLADEVTHARRS